DLPTLDRAGEYLAGPRKDQPSRLIPVGPTGTPQGKFPCIQHQPKRLQVRAARTFERDGIRAAPQQDRTCTTAPLPDIGPFGPPPVACRGKRSFLHVNPAVTLHAPGPDRPVLSAGLRVRLDFESPGPVPRMGLGDLRFVIQPDTPGSEEEPAPVP